MTAIECVREPDVLDALASARWPARCDDDLRSHVAGCAICADLVEVATRLVDERDAAWDEARVPSSGIVWWRAQVRARAEDACVAARPITFAHGLLAACILSAALAGAGVAYGWIQGWAEWAGRVIPVLGSGIAADLRSTATFVQRGLFLAIGVWVLVMPLAIYLMTSDSGDGGEN